MTAAFVISFTATDLADAGVNKASVLFAGRILAGDAEMPATPDADLDRAINFLQERQAMARRKSTEIAEQVGPDFVGATPTDLALQEQHARELVGQADARVRAVAELMGYQLPADCTDPDLIQRDISMNMRRSVEACLEVGRGLRVLKEACEHGQFISRLDVLGIDAGVAQKFMQAATKFSNASTSRLLGAAGNQSKLFEMLVLDDEQLEELALTGQTGELDIDDVATMSVKELRAAVRIERAEKQAIERLASERREELDKLKTKVRKPVSDPWPEEIAGLNDEVSKIGTIADEVMSKYLLFVDAASTLTDNANESQMPAAKSAIHRISEAVERLSHMTASLMHEFETRLAGYIADDKSHVLSSTDAD